MYKYLLTEEKKLKIMESLCKVANHDFRLYKSIYDNITDLELHKEEMSRWFKPEDSPKDYEDLELFKTDNLYDKECWNQTFDSEHFRAKTNYGELYAFHRLRHCTGMCNPNGTPHDPHWHEEYVLCTEKGDELQFLDGSNDVKLYGWKPLPRLK
jgi:hypothetical protein